MINSLKCTKQPEQLLLEVQQPECFPKLYAGMPAAGGAAAAATIQAATAYRQKKKNGLSDAASGVAVATAAS